MNFTSMRFDFVLTGVVLIALAYPWVVEADEPNRAALAVDFGGERVETRCITIDGDEVQGAELLILAGLNAVIDTSSGIGTGVCQIDGLGCIPPGEDCFCQCMGGDPCTYWNYYYRDPGQAEWVYSPFGAGIRKVRPGSVEGWVWGDGHMPPAQELTFEAICASPTPQPTPSTRPLPPATPTTQVGTAEADARTVQPTASAQPQAERPVSSPSSTAQPTAAPEPLPDGEVDLGNHWLFGVVVLGLVGIAALVRLRRV
jgi:hypothetical protein